MIGAVAAALGLVLGVPGLVQAQTQAEREEFSSQVIGLTMAYYEAQRSGEQPADAETVYPSVWQWKQPAYTSMCSEAASNITDDTPMLGTYGGYFEAGNAVGATGTMAFTVVQRILGALEFSPYMQSTAPTDVVGDPAGCLLGSHSSSTLNTMYLREMRFSARSLAAMVLSDAADNFAMIVGVGDTSTYRDNEPLPSWMAPQSDQQKCYVADEDNPASDIAAQLSAALALSAKAARELGTVEDVAIAPEWESKAVAALQYAERMVDTFTLKGSTCSESVTVENCVGSTCTEIDPDDGSATEGTCALYPNSKPPNEQLFVANAALWYATGEAQYRTAADRWFQDSDDFAPSWNNVQPQGIMIMAAAPDRAGATNSRAFYRQKLAARAAQWATCSNDGVGEYGDGKAYCKRTPDGSAYPLDVPWGNMGAITNGLCIAALAEKFQADPSNSVRNRCFMQRQIGYMFNHKCAACTVIDDSNDTKDFNNTECSACDTIDSAGFSYMVGLGLHYPTRLHSRDAAYPNFDEEYLPDGNLLCGALVAGPYAHGASGDGGRTESGTDLYTNNRDLWFETEPALDYSASMICALAGYASLEGPITDCDVRSPLTGRGEDAGQLNILSSGDKEVADAPAPAPTPAPVPAPAPELPAPAPAPAVPGAPEPSVAPVQPSVAPVQPSVAPVQPSVNATAPPPAPSPAPARGGSGCGAGGSPVCVGDELDDREFECDHGFVGEEGVCVLFIPRAQREAMPPSSRTACGKEGEPVCADDMLNGREFECDFGFMGCEGICILYAEFEGSCKEVTT